MKITQRAALAAAVAMSLCVLAAPLPAAAGGGVFVQGVISLGDSSHPAAAGEARVSLVTTNMNGWVQLASGPVLTDATGHYDLAAAVPTYPNTRVELKVEYLGSGGFMPVYGNHSRYVGLPGEGEALPDGSTTFDQTLPLPTSISGRIMTTSNTAAPQGDVIATRTDTWQWFATTSDSAPGVRSAADGTFTISGLLPGAYSTAYSSNGGAETTQPFDVDTRTGNTTIPDQVAYRSSSLSGSFHCPVCVPPPGERYNVYDSGLIRVEADGSGTLLKWTGGSFGDSGSYWYNVFFPGTYRAVVRFGGLPQAGVVWTPPTTLGEAGSQDYGIDASLPSTLRIAGKDRYDNSALISANTLTPASRFDPGIGTVFVASGQNFPDALSSVPVAGSLGSPLLLVTKDTVPASVSAELTRLQPKRIVVVGGTASVSPAVEAALTGYVSSPEDIVRISGADRFAVSRALVDLGFPQGSDTMILASGWTFPDALSAGAAAVAKKAGVLLVNGGLSSPDQATLDELHHAGVTKVEIAGGPASVSPGFEAGLTAAGLTVTRAGGADRFAASVNITTDAFPGFGNVQPGEVGAIRMSDTAVIAAGLTFPDALSGAALAAKLKAPLLIAPQGCVPADALAAVESIGVQKVVVVGGTASLSTAVDALKTCG